MNEFLFRLIPNKLFFNLYRRATTAYISWLSTLNSQLARSTRYRVNTKRGLPSAEVVKAWVVQLLKDADTLVEEERAEGTSMSFPTAVQVQKAIMASLVTGLQTPPARLMALKTLGHPSLNGICEDPDCLYEDCKGNGFEIPPEGGINMHFWHGKTETWQRENFKYEVLIEAGLLSKLLKLHIEEGIKVLAGDSEFLFVNQMGR